MRVLRSFGAMRKSTPLSLPFCPIPHCLNSFTAYSSTDMPSNEGTVTTAISAPVDFFTSAHRASTWDLVISDMMPAKSLTQPCGLAGMDAPAHVATIKQIQLTRRTIRRTRFMDTPPPGLRSIDFSDHGFYCFMQSVKELLELAAVYTDFLLFP